MHCLKKGYEIASIPRSLPLAYEEQDDPISAHGYRKSTYALFKNTLPDLRSAEEPEQSRLALMRRDFEQAKANANGTSEMFKRIGYERLGRLPVCELDLPGTSNHTTQVHSHAVQSHLTIHGLHGSPSSSSLSHYSLGHGFRIPSFSVKFYSSSSSCYFSCYLMESRFRPAGNPDPSFRLFCLIVDRSPFRYRL